MESKGQALIGRMADWIAGYMFLPDRSVAIVLALWALNTWTFKRFDAVPYLCITAATKQAGKTRLMEILKMISANGRMFGAMTPAAYFRLMEAFDSHMTVYFDEAETLSSGAVGVMRTVMNTGYRKGQTIPRTVPGGGVTEFPVFGPKAFALIGDVNDTLRDRSIVITLERGRPDKDFDIGYAEAEAEKLVADIKALSGHTAELRTVKPEFLNGRDREIWTPLFSLAHALKLDRETMDDLTRCAADLTAMKTAERKRYSELAAKEDDAIDVAYGERALADLRAILRDGEKHVFSAVAVERMRALPTGPWRTFRGVGLTDIVLANLVSRYGVQTRRFRVGGRGSEQRRGYSAADIRASVKVDKAS